MTKYRNIILIAGTFFVIFLLFCLRNLDPILYPTVYAEDAVWTGKLIDNGFWDTAFHSRVFPVLGFILFYKFSLIFLNTFFGGNLFYLPFIYFILSNLFFTLCVISGYFSLKKVLPRASLFCLVLAMILMPVGTDGNEIYGRILNLGFIFPVIQVFMLSALVFNKNSCLMTASALMFALVSCLTFPVGIGIQAIFLLACICIAYKYRDKFFLSLAVLSVGIILVSVFMISGTAIHDNGGADFPVKSSSFIEFAIARVLLYPLVFSVYHRLSDVTVCLIFIFLVAAFIFIALHLIKKQKPLINKDFIATLFILLSFGIYYFSVIVMRKGLSSLFNDYNSTFPDRYFLGVNILFVVALLVVFNHTLFSKLIIFIITVPMLFFAGDAFELNQPLTKVSGSPLWTSEFCKNVTSRGVNNRSLNLNVPPEGWRFIVESYEVSEELRTSVEERCKKSSLYEIPFFDKYKPSLVAEQHATAATGQAPLLSITRIHNVDIRSSTSGIVINAIGDDPNIIFQSIKSKEDISHSSFHFTINSPIDTKLQAYYLLKKGDGYNEANSITFPIAKGENSIYLNPSEKVSAQEIRIDLPDGIYSEFTFKDIDDVLNK